MNRVREDFTVYGAKTCQASAFIPLSATVESGMHRARAVAALVAALVVELESEFKVPVCACLIAALYARLDGKDVAALG